MRVRWAVVLVASVTAVTAPMTGLPGLPDAAASASSVPTSASASVPTSVLGATVPASGSLAGPVPGNPNGRAVVPLEARAVDTSRPNRVVGNGTPASCTSQAVVNAVAAGGIITFSCGPRPVTITMTATAKVRNARPRIVLDGGGKVTLSGAGKRRILYMNTCDQAQGWTTSHCDDQETPQLTVQNLTFADGNATGQRADGGGGGAIFVRGGRVKVVNTRFVRNRCDPTGPDVGGAAIRVLDQSRDRPVYVVNSTFGGAAGQGGACANGGAVSGIGVSWEILNSVMTYNTATGRGANPARGGTPGGGSGGAIYTDGNRFSVRVAGSVIQNNSAKEGGGAVFFVSNDRTGTLLIEDSALRRNRSAGFETKGYPGIFFLGAGRPKIVRSTLR
ncbi:hypothetical protein AB0M95_28800 [Sphaerisporangium sp. NPDC051017]|uniref:hypothetical protein n=1 Tax=Sphaerisporangium sp. NPDC051017 TaxID=3154636 RepID=UPI00343213C7